MTMPDYTEEFEFSIKSSGIYRSIYEHIQSKYSAGSIFQPVILTDGPQLDWENIHSGIPSLFLGSLGKRQHR